jgi:hypothetical protein
MTTTPKDNPDDNIKWQAIPNDNKDDNSRGITASRWYFPDVHSDDNPDDEPDDNPDDITKWQQLQLTIQITTPNDNNPKLQHPMSHIS